MTRKRQPPQRERVFLTAAMSHPSIREIDAETTDPAQFGDVVQSVAFALVAAGFAALLAHGLAIALARSGYAMQMIVAGAVGLVALLIRAGQIHDSRRGRQWAAFEQAPEANKAPEFVPVADSPRTLVLDTRLRGQMIRFAQMLPTADYSLAYRRWVEKERLFTRGEFDKVRGMMAAAQPPLMKGNALTEAGRAAVGRWAVGGLTADEVHALRGEG